MEGDPPPEEDFSQIPLVERSTHKVCVTGSLCLPSAQLHRGRTNAQNWKARLHAYNDVIASSARTASDTDPFFRPFLSDPSLLYVYMLNLR